LGVFLYEGVPANALTDEEKRQLEQEYKQERQQHTQQALKRQTQQVQAATKTRGPATALDSPESGPSRRRRNPLAFPDQGAVLQQPQPRRGFRRVQAGSLLESPLASDGGEEAVGKPLTEDNYSMDRPMRFDELIKSTAGKPAQQPQQDILDGKTQALLPRLPSPPLPQVDNEEHGSLSNRDLSGGRDEDSIFQEGAEGTEDKIKMEDGDTNQMYN
jgi:hypothetical protein